MAINFPNNPNPNDTWTSGGKTWLWDGTSWKLNSTTASGIALTDLSVTTNAVGTAALSYNNAGVFSYTPPNLSGYSVTTHNHSFIGLTDTPGTYTAGKWLKVNAGGTALEWTDAPSGANTTYSLEALLSPGVKLPGSDGTTDNEFFDYQFSIDELEQFNGFQIKIVMSGTNEAKPPRFKDLRVISIKS